MEGRKIGVNEFFFVLKKGRRHPMEGDELMTRILG